GDAIEDALDALPHAALIALHFEAFNDGRGLTQASLLRRRFGFRGELRATGELLPVQLRELERCGFDSVEFADAANVATALATYQVIDVTLQPAADGELVIPAKFTDATDCYRKQLMKLNTVLLRPSPDVERESAAIVLIAGDTGDAMQLAGKRFTRHLARGSRTASTATHAAVNNQTPDAAPAFQVWFGDVQARASGSADVLVAFDDAALLSHITTLRSDGVLFVNSAKSRATSGIGMPGAPAAGGERRILAIDFDELTLHAVGDVTLKEHELVRCRNYAALGVVCALLQQAPDRIRCRTANTAPAAIRANRRALQAGYGLGRTLTTASSRTPRIQPVATRFAA
ncbi:MAG: DUF934 domain-containing protein, partial [Gammaproteobacteria bacterium]|nr:DUF934 domain-containing protein [Gammaproteobacteria bacterium]